MSSSLPPPIEKLLLGLRWEPDESKSSDESALRLPIHFSTLTKDMGALPKTVVCMPPAGTKVPVSAAIQAIAKRLTAMRHPAPERFADLLLCLVSVLRERYSAGTPSAMLDRLLGLAGWCTGWSYRVISRSLTGAAESVRGEDMGAFWFGRLTRGELSSKIASKTAVDADALFRRWGASYVLRYQTRLAGLWPVLWVGECMGPRELRRVDYDDNWLSTINAITQDYHFRLGTALEQQSEVHFRRMIGLCASHGSRFVDPSILQGNAVDATFSIFTAKGEQAPLIRNRRRAFSYVVEVPRVFEPMSQAQQAAVVDRLLGDFESLATTLSGVCDQYKSTDLHPLVRAFVDRLGQSFVRESRGLVTEAFMDSVIALELLFSERISTTDALSGRVGCLWALAESDPARECEARYRDAVREMKRLYGIRSDCVHRGDEVAQSDLEAMRGCLLLVVPVVLAWNDQAHPEDSAAHESWLKLVDYCRSTIEMGRPVREEDLTALGIRVIKNDDP